MGANQVVGDTALQNRRDILERVRLKSLPNK